MNPASTRNLFQKTLLISVVFALFMTHPATSFAKNQFGELVGQLIDSPAFTVSNQGMGYNTGSWQPERPAYDPTRLAPSRPCVQRDVSHQSNERYQDNLISQDCKPFGQ